MRVRLILPIIVITGACALSASAFGQASTHVVAQNETIYSIAREFDVSPDSLLHLNKIDNPRFLRVGTVLKIPSSATRYTVKSGDTLYGIAREHGISLDKLLKENSFGADHLLRVGEVIKIPGGGTSGGNGSPSEKSARFVQVSGLTGKTGSHESEGGERGETASVPSIPSVPVSKDTDGGIKLPVSAKPIVSDGNSSELWPHAGPRYVLSGKFPGILIHGKPGDAVTAVASGRVIYTGPYTTFGRVVFIQSSSGYVYIYGGNDRITVSPGDKVAAGATVGRLGRMPFSTGAQLYFSVWKNNRFVDPGKAPRD
jgi:lipoprotein NlpD